MHTLQDVLSEIHAANTIVVTAHISPDSDAIGSSFACARLLRSIGKDARVYLYDPVPARHQELLGDTPFSNQVPEKEFDLLLVIDTATKARVGEKVEELFALAKRTVVVDHHISNPGFGDINYVRGEAPSSSSLVLEIATALNAKLDKFSLNLLFAGLSEDTGSFRFSNSSAQAFLEGATLVSQGAEVDKVSQVLYFSTPLRRMKLRGRALETLELVADGRIALVSVSKQLLSELGCTSEDTDGLIDDVRSIEGTLAAVFLREIDSGWKASLRSKADSFDANHVASKFGGGGHRAAAGCTLREPLDKARELIADAIAQAL